MPAYNNKESKVKSNFSKISIALASPEDITERSCGEVLKPETVNYRTYKPERDGLFCEKIFGPTKDYECYCGKYKRIRYRGIVCDRCGVEVTEKKVRRERMGHITLTVPVAHIWYFKSAPNKISALLGVPSKKLESVIYYEKYIVINPGMSEYAKYDLLSEDEYLTVMDRFPENYTLADDDPQKFVAKMGAEGIYDLLKEIDVEALGKSLRQQMRTETSQQRKTDILKRLSGFFRHFRSGIHCLRIGRLLTVLHIIDRRGKALSYWPYLSYRHYSSILSGERQILSTALCSICHFSASASSSLITSGSLTLVSMRSSLSPISLIRSIA